MSIALDAPTLPDVSPPGYEWLADEPTFDPERHLALTEPDEVILLADLGYERAEIATKATPVAISAPFRILSDDGAEAMLTAARRLRAFARPASTRIERMVRGGVYRSRWLRDLCRSPEVTAHLSAIYGVAIAPHPMPVHLGHLNYEPSELDSAVDKWHHDTLPLDYVMSVTDMRTTPGGRFEYFWGTRQEAAELQAQGRTPPPDRVRAPAFPGPGAAVAMHGDMVVHRGAALTAPAERITMVNGYVTVDPPTDEQSRTVDLIDVDDPAVLYTEWARMAAWRSGQRLQRLIEELPFTADPAEVAAELRAAVADAERAAAEMQGGARPTIHYED
ncbi:MAG: hypothetical protein AAGA93_07360 [Actinomycetota bacterium]